MRSDWLSDGVQAFMDVRNLVKIRRKTTQTDSEISVGTNKMPPCCIIALWLFRRRELLSSKGKAIKKKRK